MKMNSMKFLETLRDNDLLYNLGLFVEGNEDLNYRLFPNDDDVFEIDDETDCKTLAALLTKHVLPQDSIDICKVDELLKIKNLYDKTCKIFHIELLELGQNVDMGDQLSGIFVPMIEKCYEAILC